MVDARKKEVYCDGCGRMIIQYKDIKEVLNMVRRMYLLVVIDGFHLCLQCYEDYCKHEWFV